MNASAHTPTPNASPDAPRESSPDAAHAASSFAPIATLGSIHVRRFMTGDDVSAITALLHRAYAKQVEMGLRPLAGRQSDAVTLDRVLNSECFLAFDSAKADAARDVAPDIAADPAPLLVGVILLNEHERVTFPAIFLREDTAHFAMFAVDPACQGKGVGRLLLDVITRRARDLGAVELALSMAEPDVGLRSFYERQGFAFVQFWQWPYTNYRSVILSRPLN